MPWQRSIPIFAFVVLLVGIVGMAGTLRQHGQILNAQHTWNLSVEVRLMRPDMIISGVLRGEWEK